MARIKNFLTPQWLKEFEELKRKAASDKRQATGSKHKPQANEELEGLKRYVKNTKNPI